MRDAVLAEVRDAVLGAVHDVRDPELFGVTLGELGVVRDVSVDDRHGSIVVSLTPTFLGCPAKQLMESDVRSAVNVAVEVAGTSVSIDVRWVHEPAWTPAHITSEGRLRLRDLGIAVPDTDGAARCPFCDADSLSTEAPVGSSACRSTSYCAACRNVVEVMRGPNVSPMPVSLGETRRYVHV